MTFAWLGSTVHACALVQHVLCSKRPLWGQDNLHGASLRQPQGSGLTACKARALPSTSQSPSRGSELCTADPTSHRPRPSWKARALHTTRHRPRLAQLPEQPYLQISPAQANPTREGLHCERTADPALHRALRPFPRSHPPREGLHRERTADPAPPRSSPVAAPLSLYYALRS